MSIRHAQPSSAIVLYIMWYWFVTRENLFYIRQNEWAVKFRTKSRPKLIDYEKKLSMKSKIINCNFYPCPSDTTKHSLENSKPGSFRITLNVPLVQLSKFIWQIHNSGILWLCAIFYLTLKYWLSVRHYFWIL